MQCKKGLQLHWSKNKHFLLIFVFFLPDFIMYPTYLVLSLYLIYYFLKHRGFKMNLFWPFWIYTLAVAFIHENAMGIAASLFIFILYTLAFYLKQKMTVELYIEMQYYVTLSSLVNFYFIFNLPRPEWGNQIMKFFGQFIELGHLPAFRDGYYRAYSTFDNPNLYAFILMIVLLIAFNQMQLQLTFKRYGLMMFYVGAFAINFYALLLTQTRSILPALALGMFAILVVQRKWFQIKLLVFLGSIFAIFLLTNPSLFPRLLEVEAHLPIRLNIWNKALTQIKQEPFFGKGFFTYALLFDNSDAHNIYIDSLLCFGVVGTTLLLVYLLHTAYKMLEYAHYLDLPIAIAVIVSTIAYGIFDIPLYAIQPSILFICVLSIPRRLPRKDGNFEISL